MRRILSIFALALNLSAQSKAPKIWDDKALEDWATPIAGVGVRPGHFSSAEYYAVAAQNLKTYPVYRPDREPPGYWDSLQRQKPQPLVGSALRSFPRLRASRRRIGSAAKRVPPAATIPTPTSTETLPCCAQYTSLRSSSSANSSTISASPTP